MTEHNKRSSNKFMGLLFLALSLVILGAGLYYGYESWQLTQDRFAIDGTVVEQWERVSDGDQQVQYAPVISYRVDGQEFRFVSDNYANRPAYAIGEIMPILYDLDAPENARINRPMALWGLPAGFAFAGLLLLLASIGMLRGGKSGG